MYESPVQFWNKIIRSDGTKIKHYRTGLGLDKYSGKGEDHSQSANSGGNGMAVGGTGSMAFADDVTADERI